VGSARSRAETGRSYRAEPTAAKAEELSLPEATLTVRNWLRIQPLDATH